MNDAACMKPDRAEIISWLRETDETRLEELWQRADAVRAATVGEAVHLRGLIEISNACVRGCAYCGLRAQNEEVDRYRMTREEIIECANKAVAFGYGTVVMQAGEDYAITTDWLADVVGEIKATTPLAVTLSMGERHDADLRTWREAGADRYLLRFETSDDELYSLIHPDFGGKKSDRLAILRTLRDLGYEIGSGVMIGIPGQSYDVLASDIELFRDMDIDMIGVGPYIAHPGTPLGQNPAMRPVSPGEQVTSDELMTYKVIALTRLCCPESNIPSTSALATINKATGREKGLCRGANVVMPNLTPTEYRAKYEIYPAKACIFETAEQCRGCLAMRIASIGRHIGEGRGDRANLGEA
jgi:biotin synthase